MIVAGCLILAILVAIFLVVSIYSLLHPDSVKRPLTSSRLRKTLVAEREADVELGHIPQVAPQLDPLVWQRPRTPCDVLGHAQPARAVSAPRNNPYVYKPFVEKFGEREASNGTPLNGATPYTEVRLPPKVRQAMHGRTHNDRRAFLDISLDR